MWRVLVWLRGDILRRVIINKKPFTPLILNSMVVLIKHNMKIEVNILPNNSLKLV